MIGLFCYRKFPFVRFVCLVFKNSRIIFSGILSLISIVVRTIHSNLLEAIILSIPLRIVEFFPLYPCTKNTRVSFIDLQNNASSSLGKKCSFISGENLEISSVSFSNKVADFFVYFPPHYQRMQFQLRYNTSEWIDLVYIQTLAKLNKNLQNYLN